MHNMAIFRQLARMATLRTSLACLYDILYLSQLKNCLCFKSVYVHTAGGGLGVDFILAFF